MLSRNGNVLSDHKDELRPPQTVFSDFIEKECEYFLFVA